MKLICAAMVCLQQTGIAALMAAAPLTVAMLSGCSTSAERQDVRQNERIESRTDERIDNRRGSSSGSSR
jgi:hypothetical protein